jgi:hypothetical protein
MDNNNRGGQAKRRRYPRGKKIEFWLSDEQCQPIDRLASSVGVPRSTWIRMEIIKLSLRKADA